MLQIIVIAGVAEIKTQGPWSFMDQAVQSLVGKLQAYGSMTIMGSLLFTECSLLARCIWSIVKLTTIL